MYKSHPPREGVDWNMFSLRRAATRCGHPQCEGVDWNKLVYTHHGTVTSHPQCEGVDWNRKQMCNTEYNPLSPSVWGCGLKYYDNCRQDVLRAVTLSVRVWIEMPYRLRRYSRQACHPLREGVDWIWGWYECFWWYFAGDNRAASVSSPGGERKYLWLNEWPSFRGLQTQKVKTWTLSKPTRSTSAEKL